MPLTSFKHVSSFKQTWVDFCSYPGNNGNRLHCRTYLQLLWTGTYVDRVCSAVRWGTNLRDRLRGRAQNFTWIQRRKTWFDFLIPYIRHWEASELLICVEATLVQTAKQPESCFCCCCHPCCCSFVSLKHAQCESTLLHRWNQLQNWFVHQNIFSGEDVEWTVAQMHLH